MITSRYESLRTQYLSGFNWISPAGEFTDPDNSTADDDRKYLRYDPTTEQFVWSDPISGAAFELEYWTEDYDVNTDTTYWTPNNEGPVVINPQGPESSFALSGTDNARGNHAVDLQMDRENDSEVASGDYSIVSGGRSNTASGTGSTVSGGYSNTTDGATSTVSGGRENATTEDDSTIGGGYDNSIIKTANPDFPNEDNPQPEYIGDSIYATIAGGHENIINSGTGSTIAGGDNNEISRVVNPNYDQENPATWPAYWPASYSNIGGGRNNKLQSANSTIGGGQNNTINGSVGLNGNTQSVIGGGADNVINGVGTIAGGFKNLINEGTSNATIAGGYQNQTSHLYTTVGGGVLNHARGNQSTISGGYANSAYERAFVGGGHENHGYGSHSAIPGGERNKASGRHSSVGGGYNNQINFLNTDSPNPNPNRESSTIAGGWGNYIAGEYDSLGGGRENAIGRIDNPSYNSNNPTTSPPRYLYGSNDYGTTAGGYENINYSNYSSIGGGWDNVTGATHNPNYNPDNPKTPTNYRYIINNASSNNTISGGLRNQAISENSTVGGGVDNSVINRNATIGGGNSNVIDGTYADQSISSVVGGGTTNYIRGQHGTVSGGINNEIGRYLNPDTEEYVYPVSQYATIGGGSRNNTRSSYASVGGGSNNSARGSHSSIGGGQDNITFGSHTTIAGGQGNYSAEQGAYIGGGYNNLNRGFFSTVGGGRRNLVAPNVDEEDDSTITAPTIAGGQDNVINTVGANVGTYSTIGGGVDNQIDANTSVIAGGGANIINHNVQQLSQGEITTATIGGGGNNVINSHSALAGVRSTIAGGYQNIIDSAASTIGGGQDNTINRRENPAFDPNEEEGPDNQQYLYNANYTTIGGGRNNTTDSSYVSIGGGFDHNVTGNYSTIAGGNTNVIAEYESAADPPVTTATDNGTISGGNSNTIAAGSNSSIVGGLQNNIIPKDSYTVDGDVVVDTDPVIPTASIIAGGRLNNIHAPDGIIAGGHHNTILPGPPTGNPLTRIASNSSCIGGGNSNTIVGINSTIGGGNANNINSHNVTIAGGSANTANGDYSSIGGGYNNTSIGKYTTIGGGFNNVAGNVDATSTGDTYATIGGGIGNEAYGNSSTIAGGNSNVISNSSWSTISGGLDNNITATNPNVDRYMSIIGGQGINLTSAHSIAGGRYNEPGDITWQDDEENEFTSTRMFMIGGGIDDDNRSNLFSVDDDGNSHTLGIHYPGGADLAEYYETKGEVLPVGTTVTFDNGYIRKATSSDKILGVVSDTAGLVMNAQTEHWHKKYIKEVEEYEDKEPIYETYTVDREEDVYKNGKWYRETVTEEKRRPVTEIVNVYDNNDKVIGTKSITKTRSLGMKKRFVRVINPEYDPTRTYISRAGRPEWHCIGLVGKCKVLKDNPIDDRWILVSNDKGKYNTMIIK